MKTSLLALGFAAACLIVHGAGCGSPTARFFVDPACLLTADAGAGSPCGCPGSTICREGQMFSLTCGDGGVWETTDLACVLGLNCRDSVDCDSGQVCCGDLFTGGSAPEITASNCQAGPCPANLTQLCLTSAECAISGSACGGTAMAYGGGSVSTCTAAANH